MKTILAASCLLVALTLGAAGAAAPASGIRGTTTYVVVGGVAGRPPRGRLASLEFAVAPIEDDRPVYERAILVRSDDDGKYEVTLPPGRYWVGPKAKALGPANDRPRSVIFSEKTVVVRDGAFTDVDLVQRGFAP